MIHIVGTGGVGFWLTVGLARTIPNEQLACWDDDTLEGTGALRLPWGPTGKRKVELLQGYLAMSMGCTLLPACHPRKFTGMTGLNTGDIVVDCTDMPLLPRKRLWGRIRRAGALALRVSYDGRGSIVVVSTGLPLSSPPEGGYTAMPTLGLSLLAGGLGAEVVIRLTRMKPEEWPATINIVVGVEEGMQCSPSQ